MAVEVGCQDLGVACRAVHRAATTQELVAALGAHARDKHGVELTQTLVDYAVAEARTTG